MVHDLMKLKSLSESLVDLSILNSPFIILGVPGEHFHFYCILHRLLEAISRESDTIFERKAELGLQHLHIFPKEYRGPSL